MLDAFPEYDKLTTDELHSRLFQLEDFISHMDSMIADEDAKFNRYKVSLFSIASLNSIELF